MAIDIVIKTERDAWDWLETVSEKDFEFKEPVDISFDGWPVIDLHYKGIDFDSSIPTRVMPPLLGAQKEIYRLYCQLAYGEDNLRKLTPADRERLELVFNVAPGSSNFLTNLDSKLTEVANSAVSKMESKHILYAVLVIALSWGSTSAWKSWLDNKSKQADIESKVTLTELDVKRLAIFADALKDKPDLKKMVDGVDEFRNNSLNKLKPADTFTLPGSDTDIDGGYASEVTHKPRVEAIEIRIDGEFIIQSVFSGGVDGFKVKVKRLSDGKVINVHIPEGTLQIGQKDVLKNNEWAKLPTVMQINARELRGQITSATLVEVSDIPTKKTKPTS